MGRDVLRAANCEMPASVVNCFADMEVDKMLAELYEEKRRLEAAIAAFEKLAATGRRKRGRPPKWLAEARKKVRKERKQRRDRDTGQ